MKIYQSSTYEFWVPLPYEIYSPQTDAQVSYVVTHFTSQHRTSLFKARGLCSSTPAWCLFGNRHFMQVQPLYQRTKMGALQAHAPAGEV